MKTSRRKFLYHLGLSTLALPAVSSFAESMNVNPKIKQGKLGIALAGLGAYAGGQLAPALLQTEHCYLAGAITGTPSKIPVWKEKYNIPDQNFYSYQDFDSIAANNDIDIVYVVLPNALHAEFVIRAAEAGKHVICEKPMAVTVEDCDRMIAACKKAGKMLSIGYRLHFEPHNREMTRLAKEKTFGAVQKISAGFAFRAQAGIWRLNKKLAGGGPLMDLGIYCLQAGCYISGLEPVAVTAYEGPKTDTKRFAEVEQSIHWKFEMPGGMLAEGSTSYNDSMNFVHAEAENGWFKLQPAFNYSDLRGETVAGKMELPQVNQQAKQMDDFALAIKNNRPTPVPGEMGKRDVKLIQAIYEAARSGKRIELK
ncbi:MAG TPA: Gfo/Idh/MocA family oxidoreductase [Cyclobacteriaceae bacterium]|nr:Gfo/Idh/MocA family oxidoreductase [Cyclobacteriaceae bacterium]